jgi:hypothetical protein
MMLDLPEELVPRSKVTGANGSKSVVFQILKFLSVMSLSMVIIGWNFPCPKLRGQGGGCGIRRIWRVRFS